MRLRDRHRVLNWWYQSKPSYVKLGEELRRLFDPLINPSVPGESIHTILVRTKDDDRLLEKIAPDLQKGTVRVEGIPRLVNDLLGLRVIGLRLTDVANIEAFIDSLNAESKLHFVRKPKQMRSFLLPVVPGQQIPKDLTLESTGYHSIHYQVTLGKASNPPFGLAKLQAEIQVRTVLEDAWGEIDHKYRYELSRSGTAIPELIDHGFYTFSAYLQAAALHAEYLTKAMVHHMPVKSLDGAKVRPAGAGKRQGPRAPRPSGKVATLAEELTKPKQPLVEVDRVRTIRKFAKARLGFDLSDRTVNYAARRLAEESANPSELDDLMPTSREDAFRAIYQQTFGIPPFQDELEREIDFINLLNYGLMARRHGAIVATSGLHSVLYQRTSRVPILTESVVLRSPPGGDDDVWLQVIDFQMYRRLSISITPRSHKFWRLGLKFSAQPIPAQSRRGSGRPLFHLAKPDGLPELHWMYYGPDEASSGEQPLLKAYRGEPVTLAVSVAAPELVVEVYRHPGVLQLRHSYNLATHRYCQVAAWADGQPYELALDIRLTG